MEVNSLPSWDIGSVFEGTGTDDPLPPNGPEFLYEAIEGLEQELIGDVDPDWEMFMYKPDCGGIGVMGFRVLPPRASDVWYAKGTLADMTASEAVQDLEALYDVNFVGNAKARDVSKSIWGDENIERPDVI
ncbi:hypothetical protein AOL_s00109g144 [Orbilia oligospora ATCC 24927]|uniref:Uncharacterized protein n=1 Tax=Arthrobotrys oligospora (strain ATCC 24927 / CBS 115.81 / DSM 1491) TaxID=756982 RepID=G1XKB5_ARTOA|nr:hypothetical protein AOL_s00109g144 [Orbilia oligospora ATCC 24927]EGX46386.1 hypothetical protein AOL_s00109g144 [Orbilia oligospora ATCC 24927]